MERPSITVLMAVRDGSAFLPAALSSILRQSFAGFELLIIDDGSAEDAAAILRKVASEDQRVRLVRQDAGGLVTALNSGLELARSDLIARMDGDDIAESDRLAVQLARMSQDPALLLLGSAYQRINDQGRRGKIVHPPCDPQDVAARLMRQNCIAHPTVMYRRAAVLAAGGYRAAFKSAEDYDLWLRLAERGPLANIDAPLLRYRQHAMSVSLREIEQQTVSELAAQAAAAIRRRGGLDPISGDAALLATDLPALGVSRDRIDARLRKRLLGAARLARRADDRSTAAELRRQARARLPTTANWRTRLGYLGLLAKSYI